MQETKEIEWVFWVVVPFFPPSFLLSSLPLSSFLPLSVYREIEHTTLEDVAGDRCVGAISPWVRSPRGIVQKEKSSEQRQSSEKRCVQERVIEIPRPCKRRSG